MSIQGDAKPVGMNVVVDKTWDGHAYKTTPPIKLHMEWLSEEREDGTEKRAIKCTLQAPFYNDPPSPPLPAGICPGLWDYEVFEVFIANDRDQYVEVEVGPHGHWLVLLLDGVRKPFNEGEDLELTVKNAIDGAVWKCEFEIPLAYLPANVSKLNAYHIHGPAEKRVYKALSPVTDGSFAEPDYHRLQFFKSFNIRDVIPEPFGMKPYVDKAYENYWDGR